MILLWLSWGLVLQGAKGLVDWWENLKSNYKKIKQHWYLTTLSWKKEDLTRSWYVSGFCSMCWYWLDWLGGNIDTSLHGPRGPGRRPSEQEAGGIHDEGHSTSKGTCMWTPIDQTIWTVWANTVIILNCHISIKSKQFILEISFRMRLEWR